MTLAIASTELAEVLGDLALRDAEIEIVDAAKLRAFAASTEP